MSQVLTATEAYSFIAQSLESIKSNEPETIATMSVGDTVRQGDILITLLDGPIADALPIANRQLAPGSSQGSRHIVNHDWDVATVPEGAAVETLKRLVPACRKHERFFTGPMIRTRGPVTIEHPEHGWKTMPGESYYLVTYQRTFADEIRRVQD